MGLGREKFACWWFVTLPALWLGGVSVTSLAHIGLAIGMYFLVTNRRQNASLAPSTPRPGLMIALMIGYLVCSIIVLIANTFLGKHGIDHAIFSQVVESISSRHSFESSLNRFGWTSFIADHFSPILAVPGMLTLLGVPGHIALTLFHATMLAIGFWAFFLIGKELALPLTVQLVAIVLVLFNPAIRTQLFWGAQVEFLAFPFLAFAWLFWLRDRHRSAALCMIAAWSCKETLFLYSPALAGMFLTHALIRKTLSKRHLPYVFVIVASGLALLAYTTLHPYFFGKTYDYSNRIDWLLPVSSFAIFGKKVWYLCFLFIPYLFLPLWRRQWWIFIIPIVPGLGLAWISNFEPMYTPLSHYGVLPSLLLSLGCLMIIAEKKFERWIARPAMLMLLISINFSFASSRPTKSLREIFHKPLALPSQLADIPTNARVVVSPTAALALMPGPELLRLHWATGKEPDYDYLVVLQSEKDSVNAELSAHARLCWDDPIWFVLCKH